MARLLQTPDAHPIALDMFLLQSLGPGYYEYEPETVWLLCAKGLGGAPSEVNRTKIQAARSVHSTTQYATRWEAFEKVVAGLNGVLPTFGLMQRPALEQLWAAVVMLGELRDAPFSDEVCRYCAAALLSFDVHYAPPPLDYCAEHVGDVTTPEVKRAWERGDAGDDEDVTGIQVSLLRGAEAYSRTLDQRLVDQLAGLKDLKPLYLPAEA